MPHILDAVILGAIQGLTEFLPVSSSGHLILAHAILGYNAGDSLTFDVALHVGTLLALVAYFWIDLGRLMTGFFSSFQPKSRTLALVPSLPALSAVEVSREQRLPWLLLVATIPAIILGSVFETFFDSLRFPGIVIVTFVIFGLMFLIAELRHRVTRGMETMSWITALGIGCAQVVALIPGVSRSGITIVAGMFAGLSREQAARFTFLLSIPTVAGAALKKFIDLQHAGITRGEITDMIVGIASAAIVGYVVIRFLLRFLAKHTLNIFAYYRFAVALIAAIALFSK